MSLLGIDIGTTGCKVTFFSEQGKLLSSSYNEYNILRPFPGYAELDSIDVWQKVKIAIAQVLTKTSGKSIKALSIASLGEAVVPVTKDRKILSSSILNFDTRGNEFVDQFALFKDKERLYRINGNISGNNYTLTKLLWIKKYQPQLYVKTYKFLFWSSFVSFMLGAEPIVDYSLANRSLLFDIEKQDWSLELLKETEINREKLPKIVPPGTAIGKVTKNICEELKLLEGAIIVAGSHDQCSNALGCGVIEDKQAMYGMGTFTCIVPVFNKQNNRKDMLKYGLNTEHHAVPEKYVSFIYNQGGSIIKWYRDTFASFEHNQAKGKGEDIYIKLFNELTDSPGRMIVLPHFSKMGAPDFISNSCGLFAGLYLDSTRDEVLKAILEGLTFSLRECLELIPDTIIEINDFRVVGGGSKSDSWIQLSADIMGKSFIRPKITDAGTLGAAIIAGAGIKIFSSLTEAIDVMVKIDKVFDPNINNFKLYNNLFKKYKSLWPLVKEYLIDLNLNYKTSFK